MTPEQILTYGLWTVVLIACLLAVAFAKLSRETVWRRCRDCKHFFRGNVKLPFLPMEYDGTFHWDECLDCAKSRMANAARNEEIADIFKNFKK